MWCMKIPACFRWSKYGATNNRIIKFLSTYHQPIIIWSIWRSIKQPLINPILQQVSIGSFLQELPNAFLVQDNERPFLAPAIQFPNNSIKLLYCNFIDNTKIRHGISGTQNQRWLRRQKLSKIYNLGNTESTLCKILLIKPHICSIHYSFIIRAFFYPVLYHFRSRKESIRLGEVSNAETAHKHTETYRYAHRYWYISTHTHI